MTSRDQAAASFSPTDAVDDQAEADEPHGVVVPIATRRT
jgi:hypothetical protein